MQEIVVKKNFPYKHGLRKALRWLSISVTAPNSILSSFRHFPNGLSPVMLTNDRIDNRSYKLKLAEMFLGM